MGFDFLAAAYRYGDRRGLKPVHLAALTGHIEVVRRLIQIHSVDVEISDERSRTALSWAAQEGHCQIVKLLLEKGADVNAQGGEYGNDLQAASSGGHVEIASRQTFESEA